MSNLMQSLIALFEIFEESVNAKNPLGNVELDCSTDVILEPGEYINDDGEKRYMCTINVQLSEEIDLDDDQIEQICDTIQDFLRFRELDEELTKIGIDPEDFDWFPVVIEIEHY
jgi:hypothetical protein